MKQEEPSFKSGVSDSLKDLILHCLKRNPADRIKIEDILKHEAFQEKKVKEWLSASLLYL